MNELNKIVQEQGKNKSIQTLLHELGQENSFLNLVDLERRYRTSKMTLFDIQNERNSNNELYKIEIYKFYLRSDEHTKPEEVHSGDIIVATNLEGRETDLKIMTNNSRIEQQAFGRAGRQEQLGSARLNVFKEYDRSINKIQLVENWKRL